MAQWWSAVTRARVELGKPRSELEGVLGRNVAFKRYAASSNKCCEKAHAMAAECDAATAKF